MKDLKIHPFLDLLAPAFESNYTLVQNISVDESRIPFKGRLNYKQYIPNKPHSWGMKAFVLADGYMYHLGLYLGSETDLLDSPGYNHTECSSHSAGWPPGKGTHLFTDRFYTSIPLLDKLTTENTSLTGTIQRNRRLLPPEIKGLKLEKGETKSFVHGQNFLFWRDKRDIFMASNAHGSEMLTLPSKVPGQLDRKKPKVVNDYNQAMGGVDKADQLGVYYCIQLKSFKWWKKVFFWLLEVAVVNSYLHKETVSRPLSHLGFRRSPIKSLVSTIDFAARPQTRTTSLP